MGGRVFVSYRLTLHCSMFSHTVVLTSRHRSGGGGSVNRQWGRGEH